MMLSESPVLAPGERQMLLDLANQLRVDAIRTSTAIGSGHPTSAMSCAELMAVLMKRHFRFDWASPRLATNDRIVLSKGHVSGLWYGVLRAAGVVDDAELMTYRRDGSRLQGHPTPSLPWVDVATGSLGQGLGVAVGMAYGALHLEGRPLHVWALCGDGELAEGSMWEAFDKAALYGLRNLTALIDVNGFGQSGPVPYENPAATYAARISAFGWEVIEVDGHDVEAVDRALRCCHERDRPTAIVARTEKGHGFDGAVGRSDMHGVAFDELTADRIVRQLAPAHPATIESRLPHSNQVAPVPPRAEPHFGWDGMALPAYGADAVVEIRAALGHALEVLGSDPRLVVVDGDVTVSMRTDAFHRAYPERFVQAYIAEQQMLGFAMGLCARGFRPVVSTYAAFLTRAFDFMRMAAISGSSFVVAGSHGGVEVGRDGPSQMGLEDLAMARSLYRSTVLYPSDATSTAKLLALAVGTPDIAYLRVTRGAYPVLYDGTEHFTVGGAKTLAESPRDVATVIAAGVTVHEALKAARELAATGVQVRVIDAYSVKPVAGEVIADAVVATGGRVVVVEDHRPEGGLGSAVFEEMAVRGVAVTARHLAVRNLPGSASTEEQLRHAGISASHITRAVRETLDDSGAKENQ